MKTFILVLLVSLMGTQVFAWDREQACRGEISCFIALDGPERGLCQAYVEGQSCFIALDGEDRGWCQVLKEGQSCFMALDGPARKACEDGYFPSSHTYWSTCPH